MKTIHRYTLSFATQQTYPMPAFSTILKVGMQNGLLRIWALVDTKEPMQERTFCIVETNQPAEIVHKTEYLDSVFDGPYVWHVFEKKK